ncbi:MAG: AGE family epimerase/isomerase [Pseudomonadota bacterium]
MVDDALKARARKAKSWMLEASLPFWANHGVHPKRGFRERLTMDATPIDDDDTRVRLQARQTFCFAFGKVLGWSDDRADDLVARGLDVLTAHCRRPDGLFGARMAYGGGLSVESADLYDTAFALLGFSWAHRIGAQGALEAAVSASAAIDDILKRPAIEGGYREALPAPHVRLQNPHMHLFESSLAFHEATGDAPALARAQGIEALLELRFLTGEGALREVFTPDWGPSEGDRFEAGHQYEWAWLMAERSRLTGEPISKAAGALYSKAIALTGPENEVALSHTLDGDILDATERTWGLTEALKAHLARMIQGDTAAEARAIATFDRMWTRHVDPAPEGGWLDKYGPDGKPVMTDMTAATGYHIYVAIAEMERICDLLS